MVKNGVVTDTRSWRVVDYRRDHNSGMTTRRGRAVYSDPSAFFIIASDASGPLKPTRYSSRIGAKHS